MMVLTEEQKEEFERLSRPLTEFLIANCPDGVRVVIYHDRAVMEEAIDEDSDQLH